MRADVRAGSDGRGAQGVRTGCGDDGCRADWLPEGDRRPGGRGAGECPSVHRGDAVRASPGRSAPCRTCARVRAVITRRRAEDRGSRPRSGPRPVRCSARARERRGAGRRRHLGVLQRPARDHLASVGQPGGVERVARRSLSAACRADPGSSIGWSSSGSSCNQFVAGCANCCWLCQLLCAALCTATSI